MNENKIPIRFFVITFSWTWLFILPFALMAYFGIIPIDVFYSSNIFLPVMFIGIFGPVIGAFVSLQTINGKSAIKPFIKSFLSLNFGWKSWIAIFLIFGGSAFIAWILPEFFGEARLPSDLPNAFIFPLYLLLMIFFGGGQEEIGWRGYILPFLEKRFGLIVGSLILGLIHAIWHLPLWFIPGMSQSYMNFFAFILFTIGGAYILSWIIKASGNRLFSGLVAHGATNAFSGLFPWLIMVKGVKQPHFWIHCILIFIIGIVIVLLRTLKNRKYGT